MRVGLVTSWPPWKCGIAEYGVNLTKHKQPDVEYKIIVGASWAKPFTDEQVFSEAQDCDIVHMSWEYGMMLPLTPEPFFKLRNQGKKLVLSYHNVWPGGPKPEHAAMFPPFHTILSHDKQAAEEYGYTHIPHGIVEAETVSDDKVERKLGMAGFPKFNKGGHIMARVAKELGLGVLLFAPHSIHADAGGTSAYVRTFVPDAEIVHDFMPHEYIVRRLSECIATCGLWATHSQESGVSGSVRLGIGAKRPVVATRALMYRDLRPYDDEIYFVESDTPTFENVLPVVKQALEGKKRPNRIIKDMNWTKVAEMHAQVYRGLTA